MPEFCGSLAFQWALGEEAVSGEGPYLLALKLPSKVENGGAEGKERQGLGKELLCGQRGLAQHEEAGCLFDRLFLGLAG